MEENKKYYISSDGYYAINSTESGYHIYKDDINVTDQNINSNRLKVITKWYHRFASCGGYVNNNDESSQNDSYSIISILSQNQNYLDMIFDDVIRIANMTKSNNFKELICSGFINNHKHILLSICDTLCRSHKIIHVSFDKYGNTARCYMYRPINDNIFWDGFRELYFSIFTFLLITNKDNTLKTVRIELPFIYKTMLGHYNIEHMQDIYEKMVTIPRMHMVELVLKCCEDDHERDVIMRSRSYGNIAGNVIRVSRKHGDDVPFNIVKQHIHDLIFKCYTHAISVVGVISKPSFEKYSWNTKRGTFDICNVEVSIVTRGMSRAEVIDAIKTQKKEIDKLVIEKIRVAASKKYKNAEAILNMLTLTKCTLTRDYVLLYTFEFKIPTLPE